MTHPLLHTTKFYVTTVLGTWVQCSKKDCMRWRYLTDVHDPALLPDVWTCTMNTGIYFIFCSPITLEYLYTHTHISFTD